MTSASGAVPPEVRVRLAAALPDAPLPDPLPLNRTIDIYHEVAEFLAEERSSRGVYQIRAEFADGEYFLDCYMEVQSPMLISGHWRIHQDGRREELEELERPRFLGTPEEEARERKRVAEHNARVTSILRKKGFGWR